MRKCITPTCDNTPFGMDKLCTPCSLHAYYNDPSKPADHNYGD